MKRKELAKYAARESMREIMQTVLGILDADDGKSSEEKKKATISYLKSLISEIQNNAPAAKGSTKELFWSFGEIECMDHDLILRAVGEGDRSDYLRLKREYALIQSVLQEETICNRLWNEHKGSKTLNCSIIKDGNYIGYCGINDITQDPWEIAIELQPEWTNKGIGHLAITVMLDAIHNRLGVTEYKVRIEPANLPSQKLFEKLGAKPDGIAEWLLHDPQAMKRCEEANEELLDANMIAAAEKFSVEPQKLLSHVLVYRLQWKAL